MHSHSDTGRLAGKIALITGGGSGIGRGAAVRFAKEGAAAIVIVDLDGDQAASVGRECHAAGAQPVAVQADVTDPDAASSTIATVVERFGRLDVLMTSAGISVGRTLVDTTPEEWDLVFDTNVKGTYLWLRAGLVPMLGQGSGSVITVASQLAVNGGRSNAAYIASKGAVVALTRTTANDCASRGVRVNALLPGATETPLLDRSFGRLTDPAAARERSRSRHPLGRFGTTEEVASAAVYLASDESSFTTGAELRVDGGWIAG